MRTLKEFELKQVSGGWFSGDPDEPEKPSPAGDPEPDTENTVDEIKDPFFEWGTWEVTCCPISVDAFNFDLKGWLTTPQPAPEGYDYKEDPYYYENNGGSGIAAPY